MPKFAKPSKEEIDLIFKRFSRTPEKTSKATDLFSKTISGTRDWSLAKAITQTNVLDLVTKSKNSEHKVRMVCTGCYRLFQEGYFSDFYDWNIPSEPGMSWEDQQKNEIVLVWDFVSQDWRYINLQNWTILGSLPLIQKNKPNLENIIRLAIWYKRMYKPQGNIKHMRFRDI